jgi:hypothetical protein
MPEHQLGQNGGAITGDGTRRRSTGVFEMTDSHGRRKTVQLEELTDADQALAGKFGYNPVRQHHDHDHYHYHYQSSRHRPRHANLRVFCAI